MPREVLFFATISDLMVGIQKIEDKYSLKYIRTGLFDEADNKAYDSALEIEELGYNKSGDGLAQSYLVLEKSEHLNIRRVPQQRGGVKFAIDQQENSDALRFSPGGLYGDGFIIFGSITTMSTSEVGLKFSREYTRTLTKGFFKVERYYVGPEAKELSSQRRLITINIRQSPEYDLKIT